MIMIIIFIILLLSAFLTGVQYMKKIKVNNGEQRQLVDNIF